MMSAYTKNKYAGLTPSPVNQVVTYLLDELDSELTGVTTRVVGNLTSGRMYICDDYNPVVLAVVSYDVCLTGEKLEDETLEEDLLYIEFKPTISGFDDMIYEVTVPFASDHRVWIKAIEANVKKLEAIDLEDVVVTTGTFGAG